MTDYMEMTEAFEQARTFEHPWQMTRDEWNAAREEVRANVAQCRFTAASGSQEVARHGRLVWLLYGVCDFARQQLNLALSGEITLSADEFAECQERIDTPVTHTDVIGKALSEGQPVPLHVIASLQPNSKEAA